MNLHESLISVVIPVFNVEKYLNACITSVLNQSYENLEIILVNDGSTDNSPVIVDQYAREDGRVRVIHKTNGGLSDARNAGMKKASGDYVTFIDSDDWVDKDFIKNLYLLMTQQKADVGISNYCRASETGRETEESMQTNPDQCVCIYNNLEALRACYLSEKHGMKFTTWGKVYRASLWKDHGINFPVGKIHEDSFTTYKVLFYSGNVVYDDSIYYHYRRTSGSIMQTESIHSRMDNLEAAEGAWRFFLEKNEKRIASLAANYYCRLYFNVYYHMLQSRTDINNRMRYENHDTMREKIRECLKACQLPAYKKAAYTITADCPCKALLKKLMAE